MFSKTQIIQHHLKQKDTTALLKQYFAIDEEEKREVFLESYLNKLSVKNIDLNIAAAFETIPQRPYWDQFLSSSRSYYDRDASKKFSKSAGWASVFFAIVTGVGAFISLAFVIGLACGGVPILAPLIAFIVFTAMTISACLFTTWSYYSIQSECAELAYDTFHSGPQGTTTPKHQPIAVFSSLLPKFIAFCNYKKAEVKIDWNGCSDDLEGQLQLALEAAASSKTAFTK